MSWNICRRPPNLVIDGFWRREINVHKLHGLESHVVRLPPIPTVRICIEVGDVTLHQLLQLSLAKYTSTRIISVKCWQRATSWQGKKVFRYLIGFTSGNRQNDYDLHVTEWHRVFPATLICTVQVLHRCCDSICPSHSSTPTKSHEHGILSSFHLIHAALPSAFG